MRNVRVYERGTGRELFQLTQHKVESRCCNCASGRVALAFSPDGRTLASAWRDVVFTDVSNGETTDVWAKAGGSVIAYSPNGKLLAVARDRNKAVSLLEIGTRNEIAEFAGHEGKITALAFSPNGRFLASGSIDRTILIWRLPPTSETP